MLLCITVIYPVHVHLKIYSQYIINRYIIAIINAIYNNSCHITIPCAYERVRTECKCSAN